MVSAVTAAVHAPIALLWWRRARVRSRTLRLVAAVEPEPYHAAVLRGEATEAAAAELVLGGYLRIDGEGAAFLTEQGRDPARTPGHPLPAALLEAVRRHDPEPVSIGWIHWWDEDYPERLRAYRRERDALLPVIPRMPGDERNLLTACCGCAGIALVMLFWLLAGALLVTGRPQGLREWAWTAVAALGLAALLLAEKAGRAVRERTEPGDPLGDLVRAEPHPAFAALDEERRTLVLLSLGEPDRWRGAGTVVHEEADHEGGESYESDESDESDDEWLDDKVWWEDAYEYRASDEDEPDATPPRPASSG